jgi:hypothetical protein
MMAPSSFTPPRALDGVEASEKRLYSLSLRERKTSFSFTK